MLYVWSERRYPTAQRLRTRNVGTDSGFTAEVFPRRLRFAFGILSQAALDDKARSGKAFGMLLGRTFKVCKNFCRNFSSLCPYRVIVIANLNFEVSHEHTRNGWPAGPACRHCANAATKGMTVLVDTNLIGACRLLNWGWHVAIFATRPAYAALGYMQCLSFLQKLSMRKMIDPTK